MPGMQDSVNIHKSVNVIHNINNRSDKMYDLLNKCTKIIPQNPKSTHNENLQQTMNRRKHSVLDKEQYGRMEKTTGDITIDSERMFFSSKIENEARISFILVTSS